MVNLFPLLYSIPLYEENTICSVDGHLGCFQFEVIEIMLFTFGLPFHCLDVYEKVLNFF